jgi:hypothetical protein
MRSQHGIVVWGASGNARLVADAIRLHGAYEIVCSLDEANVCLKNIDF